LALAKGLIDHDRTLSDSATIKGRPIRPQLKFDKVNLTND